jgi:2-methylisocitrate lyase-like PEP mutase family enzyme
MSTLAERAARFAALHLPGTPLVLFNAWDAGSARAIAAGGAAAVATGSWSVAAAHGYQDGEALPFRLAIANLERIVAAVEVPVSIDLEGGYGPTPGNVSETVEQAVQAGAVGCNLEDAHPENGQLRPIDEQAARIRSAARTNFFINARTDLFLRVDPAAHTEAMIDEAIARADAYAQAGASGFFAPGLTNPVQIARLAKSIRLPLNIMVTDRTPDLTALAQLGVARVSHGPRPYSQMMSALTVAAQAAMQREMGRM